MKFAANTMNFFKEVPFPDNFKAIKRAGLDTVEILFPYYQPVEQVKAALDEAGLAVSIIDVLPGDLTKLDFNAAIDPARKDEFKKNAENALLYAQTFKVKHVNCLSGISTALKEVPQEKQFEVYRDNLLFICSLFKGTGIDILIEPVSQLNLPGYMVSDIHQAAALVKDMNLPNLALQFDFFHVQLTHGNLFGNLKTYFDMTRYYQIANPPGRNEPGCGEIDYAFLLNQLRDMGYQGYVGLEYNPSTTTDKPFAWIERMGLK
jgi:hydroxypyruvate isomerase